MNVKRTISAGVTSLGLVVGLAGFAGATTGSNTHTGPDSMNKVTHKASSWVHVKNNNDIRATNTNHQTATTGDAESEHNTTGGGASTGDAWNDNSMSATVKVDNSGSGSVAAMSAPQSGSFNGENNTTGPDSYNVVKSTTTSHVDVTNNNDISINNSNTQSAYSGDATVEHNTTGGSATTGDAANSNSTTLNLSVSN